MTETTSRVEAKLGSLQAWVIAGLFFILTFAATFTAWGAYQAHKLSDNRAELAIIATQTHSALCTLRADLQHRIDDANKFLVDHPNGIPGISAQEIKNSINNEEQTVNALAPLKC